jgi:hypothetical protein
MTHWIEIELSSTEVASPFAEGAFFSHPKLILTPERAQWLAAELSKGLEVAEKQPVREEELAEVEHRLSNQVAVLRGMVEDMNRRIYDNDKHYRSAYDALKTKLGVASLQRLDRLEKHVAALQERIAKPRMTMSEMLGEVPSGEYAVTGGGEYRKHPSEPSSTLGFVVQPPPPSAMPTALVAASTCHHEFQPFRLSHGKGGSICPKCRTVHWEPS